MASPNPSDAAVASEAAAAAAAAAGAAGMFAMRGAFQQGAFQAPLTHHFQNPLMMHHQAQAAAAAGYAAAAATGTATGVVGHIPAGFEHQRPPNPRTVGPADAALATHHNDQNHHQLQPQLQPNTTTSAMHHPPNAASSRANNTTSTAALHNHVNRVPSPNVPSAVNGQEVPVPPRPLSIPLVRQPHQVQPLLQQQQLQDLQTRQISNNPRLPNNVQNHANSPVASQMAAHQPTSATFDVSNASSSATTASATTLKASAASHVTSSATNGSVHDNEMDVDTSKTNPSLNPTTNHNHHREPTSPPAVARAPTKRSLIVRSPADRASFWSNVYDFYHGGTFCDLRFTCQDNTGQIDCHRLVLSLFSNTLRQMLFEESEEASGPPLRICLPDFAYEEVKASVDLIYNVLRENGCDEKTMGLIFDSELGKALDMTEVAWEEVKQETLVKVEVNPKDYAEEDNDNEEGDSENKSRPKRRGRPPKRAKSTGYDFNDPFIASDDNDSLSTHSSSNSDFNDFDIPSEADSPFEDKLSGDESKAKVKNEFGEWVEKKRPKRGRKRGKSKSKKRAKVKVDWEVKERQCDACGEVFQTRDHKEYRLYQRHTREETTNNDICKVSVYYK